MVFDEFYKLIPVITTLISLVTALIVAFIGWRFSVRTERIKTNYGFLNFKLQKLQDVLEKTAKYETEFLKSIDYFSTNEYEKTSNEHVMSVYNGWKTVKHFCYSIDSSEKEQIEELGVKLARAMGNLINSQEKLDEFTDVYGEFSKILEEILVKEITSTMKQLGVVS
jgi:hypothetical protein